MAQDLEKAVVIEDGSGTRLELTLSLEDGKYATAVRVNGVFCHLEAMSAERFLSSYKADDDADYRPQVDKQGHAFLLLPFTQSE